MPNWGHGVVRSWVPIPMELLNSEIDDERMPLGAFQQLYGSLYTEPND